MGLSHNMTGDGDVVALDPDRGLVYAESNGDGTFDLTTSKGTALNRLSSFLPPSTWGSKPAANAVPVGSEIVITDVPAGGRSTWISDGVYWRPTQQICLYRSAVPSATLTGTLTKTALATVAIPAGLLQETGGIFSHTTITHNNNANTKTISLSYGAFEYYINTPSTTTWSSADHGFLNVNATNAQKSTHTTYSGGASSIAAVPSTGAVDSTAQQNLIVYGQLANIGDNMRLETLQIWLV